MPTITSTYLIPAILLNPAFVLHLINTFISHIVPPPPSISHSPRPFIESIGPVRNAAPYLDMHADDQLCWGYTAVMVVVQVLAFGRVNENRVRRKSARAAEVERERLGAQEVGGDRKRNGHANGGVDGACDLAAAPKPELHGAADSDVESEALVSEELTSDSESGESIDSRTETSEEELH